MIAEWGESEEEIQKHFESDIDDNNGQINSSLKLSQWRYFPHLKTEALSGRFFDRMEALQGQKNTFYVGSTLGHEYVDTTMGYSQDLINRFF